MEDGILSVDLLPSDSNQRAAHAFRSAIEESTCLRAAVAFWSSPCDLFSDQLADRLRSPGFLCTDVHLPTNIDYLAEIVRRGASVWLHLWECAAQPGELKLRFPPHLLHSKMYLFDRADAEAILWTGSHNYTRRALGGLNIEASLVTRIRSTAPLHHQASQFLTWIRGRCTPFDLSAIAYYKWLQGASSGDEYWTLELHGDAVSLVAGEHITVFEASEEEFKRLRSVDKQILVSITSDSGADERLYSASINDTGRLNRAGIAFTPRFHAFHDAGAVPSLLGPSAPDIERHSTVSSWATVVLGEPISPEYATFPMPPAERWEAAPEDELSLRALGLAEETPTRRPKALVRRAVSRAVFDRTVDIETEPSTLHLAEIAEQRLNRQPLITRKVLRSRS